MIEHWHHLVYVADLVQWEKALLSHNILLCSYLLSICCKFKGLC